MIDAIILCSFYKVLPLSATMFW